MTFVTGFPLATFRLFQKLFRSEPPSGPWTVALDRTRATSFHLYSKVCLELVFHYFQAQIFHLSQAPPCCIEQKVAPICLPRCPKVRLEKISFLEGSTTQHFWRAQHTTADTSQHQQKFIAIKMCSSKKTKRLANSFLSP